ncbi:MFS transporter [Marinobacter daepoensis]|uniref:MFS transporter n=1 Tax=Marinobacter daepoensis TaxID=262077 RepID=A0ABS3BH91_9GAMM|nr:MFS transporter [Marinobacter daepoensis]MBN7770863.1 MFS transporter [Marinobacter daepoensis]MBY6078725.1 MFS transporter [Marinobacter daepoensis]
MQLEKDDDKLASLAVVLPLALTGFVVAAGCWTLFAVAGVHLRADLGLNSLQFGVLLAMPMAVSAMLAIPAGLAAQRYGAREVMLLCLCGLAVCMGMLLLTETYAGYLVVAAGLGLAGGFYGAGLQFVVSHCDSRRLGLVLGVFGAGVTGAGFTYYLVPLFHEAFSWQGVPLAYLIVLLLVIALLLMLTDATGEEDNSRERSAREILGVIRQGRNLPLSLYFGIVAGSFFSLALWLPDFLSGQYGLSVDDGARLSQWFVIPGAVAQVAGGGLSDRFGSARVTIRALIGCLVSLLVLSYPPMTLFITGVESEVVVEFGLPVTFESGVVVALGVALGAAMGSLQRMVILANRQEASLFAGVLLVSACAIAFALPVIFGAVNQWLGVRTAVFMILFLLLCCSLFLFSRHTRREERSRFLHPGI